MENLKPSENGLLSRHCVVV